MQISGEFLVFKTRCPLVLRLSDPPFVLPVLSETIYIVLN